MSDQELIDHINQRMQAVDAEVEHLAQLAYAGGDKALQRGWWSYVKKRAEKLGIERAVLARVNELKTQSP